MRTMDVHVLLLSGECMVVIAGFAESFSAAPPPTNSLSELPPSSSSNSPGRTPRGKENGQGVTVKSFTTRAISAGMAMGLCGSRTRRSQQFFIAPLLSIPLAQHFRHRKKELLA